MKKVIFVCLLSLSVCFSQASTQGTAAQTPVVVSTQNATATDAKAAEVKPEPPKTTVPAAGTPATPPVVTAGAQNATAANATQAVPVSNETSNETTTKETKPAENNTSTETKPSADPAKPVDPPKGHNETKPAGTVPANNGTNSDSKDGKKNDTTTTPKSEIVSPTVAPVEAKSRAFDGPSFIGGIILTLGLLAIGFMGFKYYKNQTERNYHTL